MTYRDLVNRSVMYQAAIRDRDIDNKGIPTRIKRPLTENNLDFYGDPITDYDNDDSISIIPLYTPYYQIIDVAGQGVELELALEAYVKVSDYIPNNSLIYLEVRNNSGSLEKRWWRVLTTQVKHIERHYARTAHLVPLREPIHEYNQQTIDVETTTNVLPLVLQWQDDSEISSASLVGSTATRIAQMPWTLNVFSNSGVISQIVEISVQDSSQVTVSQAAALYQGSTDISSTSEVDSEILVPVFLSSVNKGASVVLSNNDLTAGTSVRGLWTSVLGTIGQTSGKRYMEFFCDLVSPPYAYYGVANQNFDYSDGSNHFPGNDANSAALFAWYGNVYSAGTETLYYPVSQTARDNVSMAVDIDAGLLWWRVNGGPWNAGHLGAADPASGLGGFSFSISGALFPVLGIQSIMGSFGTVTANFGGLSYFTYPPPYGFKSW